MCEGLKDFKIHQEPKRERWLTSVTSTFWLKDFEKRDLESPSYVIFAYMVLLVLARAEKSGPCASQKDLLVKYRLPISKLNFI